MTLLTRPEPAYGVIEDLYRACYLPPPMVIVARDAVHFARLVKAWSRNDSPGPVFLSGFASEGDLMGEK